MTSNNPSPRWLIFVVVVIAAAACPVFAASSSSSSSLPANVSSSNIVDRRRRQLVEQNASSSTTTPPPNAVGLVVDAQTIERYKAAPPGQKQPPSYYSESYLPRATPYLTRDDLDALHKDHGSWTLVDDKADSRPQDDFYQQFPNRDVDKFPTTAWQVDKEYLGQFLPEALALTERAMEAILDEYGHGKHQNSFNDDTASLEERSRRFAVTIGGDHQATHTAGGWMPDASFQGLQRRLAHAILSQDRFVVAMAGHSAAAGHGNHFVQAYTGQLQRLLEPILARLGTKMAARNFGMGGLGTQQVFMAAGDIMGHDIDVLLWDSSMTEKDGAARGVLAIQALLACERAPLLWFQHDKEQILHKIHELTGADIGVYGTGMVGGFPQVNTEEELNKLPWAIRHFACSKDISHLCNERYHGKCWVDRQGFSWEGIDLSMEKPPTNQKAEPGGRAGWHPGDREHQLQARALTFPILQALHAVLKTWMNAPLKDNQWHMTEYYKTIKAKVVEHASEWEAWCEAKMIHTKFCKFPAQGRTENTPRARPWETSLRSIVSGNKHPSMNPPLNSYDPPDVYQSSLFPPAGEVNVLAIVENGVPYAKNLARIVDSSQDALGVRFTEEDAKEAPGSKYNPSVIQPGKGWQRGDTAGSDNCDGEHDSFCGRTGDCLLYGHNDGRAGLTIDGFSGWGVFNLPRMEQGVIVIKIHSWTFFPPATTAGWTCENGVDCTPTEAVHTNRALLSNDDDNHNYLRRENSIVVDRQQEHEQQQKHRQLKPPVPAYCNDFKLEYAVDGVITSLTQPEMEKIRKNPERVVEVLELYNNETFSGPRDVEFAIRLTGCGRQKPFDLTHIYWI